MLQHSLDAIAEHYGERVAEVRAAMPAATLARVDAATWRDWLPLRCDLELCEAVERTLGPGSDRERARLTLCRALQGPLLGPFVAGVQLLFDLEPASMIRQVPRGWAAVYRGTGTPRYEVAGPSLRALSFCEAPRLMLEPLYLEAIVGALHSLYDLCDVEGHVCAEDVDRAAGRVRFWFRWSS